MTWEVWFQSLTSQSFNASIDQGMPQLPLDELRGIPLSVTKGLSFPLLDRPFQLFIFSRSR
jgi:hypothetical protein